MASFPGSVRRLTKALSMEQDSGPGENRTVDGRDLWKGRTAMDQLFYGFDTAVYQFIWRLQNPVTIGMADVCQRMGDMTAYIIFFVISLILCFPQKTRNIGVAMVIAFLVAFLLVNVLIKPGVGRLRPYVTLKDTPFWETYQAHWANAGSHLEDDLSFPSGHTSLNFATFTALAAVLIRDRKRWAWALMLIPIIVGMTRIIRCVHYPSDVLGGMIIGVLAGLIGYLVATKWLPILSEKITGRKRT